MKTRLTILFIVISAVFTNLSAANKPDSLLRVLDRNITERAVFTEQKEARIMNLKQKKTWQKSLEELYRINMDIIGNYESFIYDSAEVYVLENINIARKMGSSEYLTESNLRLAFIYSLSGLFVQADDILRSMDYDALPDWQKAIYCWNRIRYNENLMKYIDNRELSEKCMDEIDVLRSRVIGLLPYGSELYDKERAFQLQAEGDFEGALTILDEIFGRQEKDTHAFAMAAMSLAKVYRLAGNREQENKYLKMAAITDAQLAVKENEALLVLAKNLFDEGDLDRAYNYISAALSDANFYNSRFRNTVIARVHPIIEKNYLNRIEKQKLNLRLYAVLASLLVIAFAVTLSINFRQTKIVSKARKNLRAMNEKLLGLNLKLDEANIIKEKYIGYFMNECAVYIDKLDKYRKDVNLKIKNGQIDRIYKPSSVELEKEVEGLFRNFDNAFLQLYPSFVEEFNAMLKPGEQYILEKDRLNTEMRIFALIRLGITDSNHISVFLRCSMQTIYNYRSKVKGKALNGDNFEAEVRKLGSISNQSISL